jgi:aldehyde:ferredoxin oxidoreductase
MQLGKILTINLSNPSIRERKITEEEVKKYLGGRGLGAHLYSQNVKEADDPDNSIFIVPGLLTGTNFASSSRLNFVSSSPLTGFLINSSAGGFFGAYLKSQGIWGLEIKGRGEQWTLLKINENGVEIDDASDLVGRNVYEVRDILKGDKGRARSVASIGRGGENLVKYSIVQFDDRAAGRAGSGWHFGYKELKAIVVDRGELPLEMSDTEKAKQLVKEFRGRKAEHELEEDVETYCSVTALSYSNDIETFPASNYRRNSVTDEEISGLTLDKFQEKTVRKEACWSCPLACTRKTKSKYNEAEVKGPEYETLWSLGANADNFDMDVVIEADRLCDEYGLDTISTGSVMAWYKECVDKGNIEDDWSPERMFELIEMVGKREGVGDKLAEGVVRAAELLEVGRDYAAHSKKLELPAWDPRTAIGMAVNYATAPTGGDHCKGWTVSADVGDEKGRFNTEEKPKHVIESQNESVVMDALGTCMFADFLYDDNIWGECIKAYLGFNVDSAELKECANRIFNLEHDINIELGLTYEDNILPPRIIGYELEVDGDKVKLTREMFDEMMENYYELRGWERE